MNSKDVLTSTANSKRVSIELVYDFNTNGKKCSHKYHFIKSDTRQEMCLLRDRQTEFSCSGPTPILPVVLYHRVAEGGTWPVIPGKIPMSYTTEGVSKYPDTSTLPSINTKCHEEDELHDVVVAITHLNFSYSNLPIHSDFGKPVGGSCTIEQCLCSSFDHVHCLILL